MKRLLYLGLCGAVAACGHTVPDGKKRSEVVDTGPGYVGHAPELIGFGLDFVEQTGTFRLVASSRLGDVDDDLVPDGTVTGVLLDDQGRERTSLDAVSIGAEPTRLPEPTLLEVDFGIADDPGLSWEVHLFVTDRGGLSSPVSKAVWTPPADTGI